MNATILTTTHSRYLHPLRDCLTIMPSTRGEGGYLVGRQLIIQGDGGYGEDVINKKKKYLAEEQNPHQDFALGRGRGVDHIYETSIGVGMLMKVEEKGGKKPKT